MDSLSEVIDSKVDFIDCDDLQETQGSIYRKTDGSYLFCCSHCNQNFDVDSIENHMEAASTNCIDVKSVAQSAVELADGGNRSNWQSKEATKLPLPRTKRTPETIDGDQQPLTGRSIKCSYCDAVFVCHGVKEQHKIVHGIKAKQNPCALCRSVWLSKAQLNAHIAAVHPNGLNSVHCCRHCSIAFSSAAELLAHQTARPLTKSGQASQRRRQQSVINRKTYQCSACPAVFPTKRSQREHFIAHGEKPFQCTECSYACRRLPSLSDHMRQHTGDKPFQCDKCGKSFPSKAYVRIHLRIHAGDKPYKCNHCEACFTISWQLSRHVRSVHGQSKLPLHVCDICGLCFKWPLGLVEHKRVHSGEKPYKCTVCEKSFPRQNTCRLHMRLHSGEQPFKCRHCDRTFKHSSGRFVHERNEHAAQRKQSSMKKLG